MKTTNNNTDLRAIMREAWAIKRNADLMYNGGVLFAECLRMAWAKLRKSDENAENMRGGVVWFYYYKITGEKRRACGTLRPDLLPPTNNESNRRPNDDLQVYYDLEKQGWRCYKKANFIGQISTAEIENGID